MRRTGPTNVQLRYLLVELKKQAALGKIELWKRIAELLEKPSRQRRIVNIRRINKLTKSGEMIIIPGKVLGDGDLDHKITIAAFNFSSSAIQKLAQAKSEYLSIAELLKKTPKAEKVRIIA